MVLDERNGWLARFLTTVFSKLLFRYRAVVYALSHRQRHAQMLLDHECVLLELDVEVEDVERFQQA